MPKKRDPKHYLEFYVGDYLRDTAHLSPTHHGVYVLLLFHYWQKGMLKASHEQCLRIAKATTELEQQAVSDVLDEFFTPDGEYYVNGRMEAELARFSAKKSKSHARAVTAAEARWAGHTPAGADAPRNATSIPYGMLAGCPPTPTPASITLPSHSSGSTTPDEHDDRAGGFEGHSPEQTAQAAAAGVALVEAAKQLRAAGCPDASASNAWLQAGFADGFTRDELVEGARRYPGKGMKYIVRALQGQRDEAASSVAGRGPAPAPARAPAGTSPKVEETPEHRIAAAIDFAAQQVKLGYMDAAAADEYVAGVRAKWAPK